LLDRFGVFLRFDTAWAMSGLRHFNSEWQQLNTYLPFKLAPADAALQILKIGHSEIASEKYPQVE
jgi:hypothetical protein